MKTTFTTQHNAASTLNGSHAAHNVYSPLRRLTLLVTLLMTFALGARAADYVFTYTYDNNTYFLGQSTTPTTSFVPNASIYTGSTGSTFRNANGYYIRYNDGLAFSTTTGTNLTTNGNQVYCVVRNYGWNYNCYLNLETDWWGNVGNWQMSRNDYQDCAYLVTPSVYISDFTVSGDDVISVTGTNSSYSHTNAGYCDVYSFNNLTYYSTDPSKAASTTPPTNGLTELTDGYTWSISDNAYATVDATTGAVSVNSLPTTNTKITLTCTVTHNGVSKTATKTITIEAPKIDPTTITAQNLTVEVGKTGTIAYQLQPDGAYQDIEYAVADAIIATVDANGVVTGVKAGTTTVTLTAKKINGDTSPDLTTTITVTVMDRCATPVITIDRNTGSTTIACSTVGATIYYTTDGSDPTESSSEYEGSFTVGNGVIVKAIAVKDGWLDSYVGSASSGGTGESASDPYYVASVEGLDYMAENPTYHFKVVADFNASGFSGSVTGFSGTFDGDYKVIKGLRRPLFTSVNGATIKNVVLDNVNISGTGNVGGIVATASGATRIYNCGVRATNGSVIGGTAYTGSIVGHLQGTSRVINCYSFADITGGSYVGGIVGYNATASTSRNLATIVMNCMYYGDIKSGTNKAPIYNGNIITNVSSTNNTGINNYNYYRYSSAYSLNEQINTYNCALAAEERYLVRHEFYRGILNSNKDLCGWYVTGQTNQPEIIGKWVLDTSIAPYPIIKPQGRYRGLVNRFITREDASSLSTEEREGRILSDEGDGGYLTVKVERGDNGSGSTSITLKLPITDMNYNTYDYNYAKVVLPFYNQYFGGNYTNNKVVTGWEITSITGDGVETMGTNAYNYADRNSEGKDKGRIFAQGGYYNVPIGVKAITITAKWADAVYLSDAYYDRAGYDLSNLTAAGLRYQNGNSYSINGSNQEVYTSLAGAMAQLETGGTVYDQAIVLVGNYHSNNETWSSGSKPFTLMSADLDNDNEPDYCVFHYHNDRKNINPVRFDFLWHPGIGMAHKANEATNMLNQGIFHPTGWFEITETALARYTEFEYGYGDNVPLILNNGIFEQFVTRHDNTLAQKAYFILGGNLYMKQFSPGVHVDNNGQTKHCPTNVLGGEYETFYLSGMFRTDVNAYNDGDVMCYTNGGKFGLMAGAGHEQIRGNIWFKIDNSVIGEFYGGGINASKPVTGDINVQIDNSFVEKFCGGPMFGTMQPDKQVETTANGTTFGRYYGAGNGGTSLNRQTTDGKDSESTNYDWNNWMSTYYKSLTYNSSLGIQVQPEYEYFAYAGGNGSRNVGRFYVNYAKFDKAQTNGVSSTLTNCTVLNDYYGGGNLGYVNGDVTSELDGCIVNGSVYGGGFSATIPTVTVYPNGFKKAPSYNGNVGVYNLGEYNEPKEYTWSNKAGLGSTKLTDGDLIWSDVPLENLGEVGGNTTITIKGNAQIAGGVYGGGNASNVSGTTTVNIEATESSFINNVFGGANQADVDGATTVNIKSGNIGNVFGANNQSGTKGSTIEVNVKGATSDYVYGAGNLAAYTGNPVVNMSAGTVKNALYGGGLGASAAVNGNPQVNMTGGTIGYTEKVDGKDVVRGGDVFGGGNAAAVDGNTGVTITAGEVKRNVYGGGNQAKVTGKTNVVIGQ